MYLHRFLADTRLYQPGLRSFEGFGDSLFVPLFALESDGLRRAYNHLRNDRKCGIKCTVEKLKGSENSWSELAWTS